MQSRDWRGNYPEIIFNRMSVLQNPVRLVDERRQAAGLES
jgi:hypothetical protein